MLHFVGAGPGAEDLITVRGRALLESADVIIYAGSLVNPALLAYAQECCTIHNSAYMTLDEVIEVIRQAEQQGKTTVRLHTGDPSIYGAIREQMDRLAELGIAFDICPGVSSFCGAAAALQAEYTLPGVAQSVILTRMAGKTPVPPRESIAALAQHGTTMIVFLSASLLDELVLELQQGGYAADTPAALVYKATWPEEKVLRGTVAELPQLAQQHGIGKTALVVVGYCLGGDYELSRLYAADFSTGFRQSKNHSS